MKTQLLPYRNPNLVFWLSITGWSLAVVVSLLYLHERSMRPRGLSPVPPPPLRTEQPERSGTSAQLEALLRESKELLDKGRPEDSISRITMLWSLCHSTGQSVPEESHQLFARAVSNLASAARHSPEVAAPTVLTRPPEEAARKTAESKTAPASTVPRLAISSHGYPKAKPSKPCPAGKVATELIPPPEYPEPSRHPSLPPPPPRPPSQRTAPPNWEGRPAEAPRPPHGPPGRWRPSWDDDGPRAF